MDEKHAGQSDFDVCDEQEKRVGYKNPPKHSRFKPGRSGNPTGRPKGSHKQPSYSSVLDWQVTIVENGETKSVTVAEAFMRMLAKEALEGNTASAKSALEAIEKVKAIGGMGHAIPSITHIHLVAVSYFNVRELLEPLRIAKLLDPYRHERAHYKLNPWAVQAALDRAPEKRFTKQEQAQIVKATRTPKRVKWPRWWTHRPWVKNGKKSG